MAARLKLYLDTSVVSARFDSRVPHRQQETVRFWAGLGVHDPCVSEHVLSELSAVRDSQLRATMLDAVRGFAVLPTNILAEQLVAAYLRAGAFSPPLTPDARHVALAVVSGVPILVSWNFRHLVNRRRRIQVNLVNAQQGYNQIEILSPSELEPWP